MTPPDRAPLANAQPDCVISRLFDAPRELVWQAWTQTEHLNRWFGPKGCTIPACSMDLRPGGIFHYGMRTPDGREMWGKWTFLEIASPGRLVLISSFSDAKGGVTRHPLSATWPLQTMSTMSLIEENGQTRMTLCWSPHQPTEVERRTFDSAHEGMKQGWSGTLDQLDSYLAAARPQIGRLDEPRVLDLPTRLLARISLTVPRSEIQEVMGSGLQELMGSLAKQGITPAGPWFTHHLRMDPEVFDFEVCVPVSSEVAATGRVRPGTWPAMHAVQTSYHGPYEGLGEAWGRFDNWIAAQGLKPAPDLWECYATGPEGNPDPSSWRTEMTRPLTI